MAQTIMQFFKVLLMVQLFFSLGITLYAYSLPSDTLPYVTSFSGVNGDINITSTAAEVQGAISKQSNIPVLDLGALIFFSGNILLDLILNFAFALPEMIGLLVMGITSIFSLDSGVVVIVEGFVAAFVLIIYFISLIQFITNLRSQSSIT